MRGISKTERMFPIMVTTYRDDNELTDARAASFPFVVVCIPWDMIAPHAKQADKNHYQTLERLAERGGLTAEEAVAVLRSHSAMDRNWVRGGANEALAEMVIEYVQRRS
jgi:hypothetical protein